MRKCIVLFESELETLNVFSYELGKGFMELGYELFMFDMRNFQISMKELYSKIHKGEVLAMIGFNSHFFGLKTPSGINVWQELGILCVNILVDHPYWYKDILESMPDYSAVLCIDENHMRFVEKMYPHISINGTMLHGGVCPEKLQHQDIKARSIDVLYAGSLYLKSMPAVDSEIYDSELIEEAVNELKTKPKKTIEEVVRCIYVSKNRLDENSLDDNIDCLKKVMLNCRWVERIVSSYYREGMLRSIANSGVKLTLCGRGYEECSWINNSNVNYLGYVGPRQAYDMMSDSKIIVNSFPWFKKGLHERIFNGMLQGAVVVSESNEYTKLMIPMDCIISYELEDYDSVGLMISNLLSDEQELSRVAHNGYLFALEKHKWADRAFEIHKDLLSVI